MQARRNRSTGIGIVIAVLLLLASAQSDADVKRHLEFEARATLQFPTRFPGLESSVSWVEPRWSATIEYEYARFFDTLLIIGGDLGLDRSSLGGVRLRGAYRFWPWPTASVNIGPSVGLMYHRISIGRSPAGLTGMIPEAGIDASLRLHRGPFRIGVATGLYHHTGTVDHEGSSDEVNPISVNVGVFVAVAPWR